MEPVHASGKSREWNWHPDLPVATSPLFAWPPQPVATVRWFWRNWLPLTEFTVYLLLAFAVWVWQQPPLERVATPDFQWIFQIWLRNIILYAGLTSALHLALYHFRTQGDTLQYDSRGVTAAHRTWSFDRQLWDNMAWSCLSGVTVWTAYECAMWWAYANGYAPLISFASNPFWFVVLILLLPVIQAFHFYCVHRLLHSKLLYDLAHAVHHRNVSPGPWSGFSMHPIEHVLYLSTMLVFLLLPSHPVHLLFLAYWLTLATATSHAGFERIRFGEYGSIRIGSFFHQIHHRYIHCNYGNVEFPLDRWFGSHHDGTHEATRRMRERLRAGRK